MNSFKKILLTSLLFISNLSYGGGWTSGGGELIRDAHNPWFLSNTKDVNYCIQIDEKEFGQSKEFVRERIVKALDFWKMQLSELTYIPFLEIPFDFKLGTQSFHEVRCDQDPDLNFQFAKLDKEQKDRLGDISKIIAVSVRTDYDLKNLKGKGFIFFNKNDQFPETPWTRTDGSRVLLVMIHELGHLFGIQHTKDVWTMNEEFPEELLDAKNNQWADYMTQFFNEGDNYKKRHLFTYKQDYLQLGMCAIGGINFPVDPIRTNRKSISVYDQFFGGDASDECKSGYLEGSKFIYQSGLKDSKKIVGEAELQMQDLSDITGIWKSLEIVHFWIPAEQTVFKTSERLPLTKISIARFQPKQFFKGTYRTLDGKISRPIGLEVSNSGGIHKISGVMDGVMYIDLQAGF